MASMCGLARNLSGLCVQMEVPVNCRGFDVARRSAAPFLETKVECCHGAVQLDVAGLLFLLVIAGTSVVMAPAHSAAAPQHSWLACLMHALPLAAMAINLRW